MKILKVDYIEDSGYASVRFEVENMPTGTVNFEDAVKWLEVRKQNAVIVCEWEDIVASPFTIIDGEHVHRMDRCEGLCDDPEIVRYSRIFLGDCVNRRFVSGKVLFDVSAA